MYKIDVSHPRIKLKLIFYTKNITLKKGKKRGIETWYLFHVKYIGGIVKGHELSFYI